MLLLASLAVLDTERGADGATINDFGDDLWWSATTVTTAGYGDRFPVTGHRPADCRPSHARRNRAAGCGDGNLRVLADRRVAEVEEASQAATRQDVEALTAEVQALRPSSGTPRKA